MRASAPVRGDTGFFERALGLLAVAALGFACLTITAPFLVPMIWGTILAVSTWPLYTRLRGFLNGRRSLAAVIMTLTMFVVIVTPIAVLAMSLADGVTAVSGLLRDLTSAGLPLLPAWIGEVPVLGPGVAWIWNQATTNVNGILEQTQPYIGPASGWALARGADLGIAIIEFLVAVLIAGLLYVIGETGAEVSRQLVARIGGRDKIKLVDLAGRTIRSVAQGVIGTAFVQGVAASFGFFIAGTPGVAFLGFLTFMVALVQVPTAVVWIPVALWHLYAGEHVWAVFIGVWGFLIVNTVDNIVRPMLISTGARLPFLLIFIGVVGGLLTWGFIGIFLGATLLAVGYTLFRDWLDEPALMPDPMDEGYDAEERDR